MFALATLLVGQSAPAPAALILDPVGDLLPTYTGAQDTGLDVTAHEVRVLEDRAIFFGRMAGPIAPTEAIGALYLFGVDRGQGTARFLNAPAAPPIIGPDVKWDSIVRINPNGTGLFNNLVAGVSTPLNPTDISVSGNEFTASVPLSLLLPSATRPPQEWTYNLWPRNGLGMNVQVSDLAPDDGNSPVQTIPEPPSLILYGNGVLGLLGLYLLRRRRRWSTNLHTKKTTAVAIALSAAALMTCAPRAARADIFSWEYINPADPSQGKQRSMTLAPDGAGVSAMPGADLSNRNLTMAYLIGADLTGSNWRAANLTNAELSQANLTGANLYNATMTNANFSQANLTGALLDGALTGANFTRAEVRGANFSRNLGLASGISLTQLYSTASYQAHDLSGIGLDYNDLTGANLAGQNLTNASLKGALMKLTNADLSQANLTNASFVEAELTGANFTGAEVRGAVFTLTFTSAQLFSTASYHAHDLAGIGLYALNLASANLAGQNLTNANFNYTTLTGANLTGAQVRGADLGRYNGAGGISLTQLYSTASYQAHDLSGIRLAGTDLTGANLSGQNLTNAGFGRAMLTGANLTGAQVRGADFTRDTYDGFGTGITAAQLYSTASYQAQDLTGIRFDGNDLTGVNVAGQNLANASFDRATLTNADFSRANLINGRFLRAALANATFSQANLTNADFSAGFDPIRSYSYVGANLSGVNLSQANLANVNFSGFSEPVYDENGVYIGENIYAGANLNNANLGGADARGANFLYATLTGTNTGNLIQSDGHIYGLDLTGGASLVVRDYDGNPGPIPNGPLPIVVEQHLTMDAAGTLRLVFDADTWDSTISFAAGIPATRAGTLELLFAPDVNLAAQIGRTIDLFDWTGVTPTDTFNVASPFIWNLSNLYTTGQVTLTAVPGILSGDYNGNGTVDAADYVAWRKGLGTSYTQNDYNVWRTHFGQTAGSGSGAGANAAVPEPATVVLLILGLLTFCSRRRSIVS